MPNTNPDTISNAEKLQKAKDLLTTQENKLRVLKAREVELAKKLERISFKERDEQLVNEKRETKAKIIRLERNLAVFGTEVEKIEAYNPAPVENTITAPVVQVVEEIKPVPPARKVAPVFTEQEHGIKTEVTPQTTEIKSDDTERVNKMLELIEKSPTVQFFASGRGNIMNTQGGPKSGFNVFSFDSESKEMKKYDSAFNDDIVNINNKFDDNTRAKHPSENEQLDKRGVPQFDVYEGENGYGKKDGYTYIIKRLPFGVSSENKNLFDGTGRPGTHFTTAIRFKKGELSSLDSEEIKKELENPQNFDFFNKVLDACANKYVPDYYNFVLKNTPNQHAEYKEVKSAAAEINEATLEMPKGLLEAVTNKGFHITTSIPKLGGFVTGEYGAGEQKGKRMDFALNPFDWNNIMKDRPVPVEKMKEVSMQAPEAVYFTPDNKVIYILDGTELNRKRTRNLDFKTLPPEEQLLLQLTGWRDLHSFPPRSGNHIQLLIDLKDSNIREQLEKVVSENPLAMREVLKKIIFDRVQLGEEWREDRNGPKGSIRPPWEGWEKMGWNKFYVQYSDSTPEKEHAEYKEIKSGATPVVNELKENSTQTIEEKRQELATKFEQTLEKYQNEIEDFSFYTFSQKSGGGHSTNDKLPVVRYDTRYPALFEVKGQLDTGQQIIDRTKNGYIYDLELKKVTLSGSVGRTIGEGPNGRPGNGLCATIKFKKDSPHEREIIDAGMALLDTIKVYYDHDDTSKYKEQELEIAKEGLPVLKALKKIGDKFYNKGRITMDSIIAEYEEILGKKVEEKEAPMSTFVTEDDKGGPEVNHFTLGSVLSNAKIFITATPENIQKALDFLTAVNAQLLDKQVTAAITKFQETSKQLNALQAEDITGLDNMAQWGRRIEIDKLKALLTSTYSDAIEEMRYRFVVQGQKPERYTGAENQNPQNNIAIEDLKNLAASINPGKKETKYTNADAAETAERVAQRIKEIDNSIATGLYKPDPNNSGWVRLDKDGNYIDNGNMEKGMYKVDPFMSTPEALEKYGNVKTEVEKAKKRYQENLAEKEILSSSLTKKILDLVENLGGAENFRDFMENYYSKNEEEKKTAKYADKIGNTSFASRDIVQYILNNIEYAENIKAAVDAGLGNVTEKGKILPAQNESEATAKVEHALSENEKEERKEIDKRIVITGTSGGFTSFDKGINQGNQGAGSTWDVRPSTLDQEKYYVNFEEISNKWNGGGNPFTFTYTRGGKKYLYASAGLGGSGGGGRDGNVFVSIELTEDLPNWTEEYILKKAIDVANEKFGNDFKAPIEFKKEYLSNLITRKQIENNQNPAAPINPNKENTSNELRDIPYTEYANLLSVFNGTETEWKGSKAEKDNTYTFEENADGNYKILPCEKGWIYAITDPSNFLKPLFEIEVEINRGLNIRNLHFIPAIVDKKGNVIKKGKILPQTHINI